MSAKFFVSAVLSFHIGCSSPAHAFLGMGDVVTDPVLTGKAIAAEAARLGQTTQMIQNQLNMYMNMVQNTMRLGDPIFAPLGNTLRSLYSVYSQGQSLMYRAQNMDSAFGMMYPSYQSYLWSMGQGGQNTMSSMYKKWSDDGNQNVRTALQSAGIQVNSMESDDAMLQRMLLRSSLSGGQMSALQAGNEIAAMNVQQLQKLQSLVAAQIELHGKFMAQENARQSVEDAWVQQYRKTPFSNSTAKEY